jgi:hypothetical protein
MNIEYQSDDGLDDDLSVINDGLQQLELHQLDIEDQFQWLDVLDDVRRAIFSFEKKIASIEAHLSSVSFDSDDRHIRGYYYSAAVGAYECFVHDIFDALILRDEYFLAAKKYLLQNKINNEFFINIRSKGKLTESSSKQDLQQIFYNATLIDATKIAHSVEHLFALNFPVPPNVAEINELRNLFVHNGGRLLNGEQKDVTPQDVSSLLNQLTSLISSYANEIGNRAHQLGTMKPNRLNNLPEET